MRRGPKHLSTCAMIWQLLFCLTNWEHCLIFVVIYSSFLQYFAANCGFSFQNTIILICCRFFFHDCPYRKCGHTKASLKSWKRTISFSKIWKAAADYSSHVWRASLFKLIYGAIKSSLTLRVNRKALWWVKSSSCWWRQTHKKIK